MSYIGKQPTKAPLTSSDIEDGIITAAKIEDGAVVAAEIASNAVTTAKINADAVTAAKIADNAVVTAGINADAVTGAKIADDAINSEHYTDGSIDTAHIAADQITAAKIADNAISEEHLDVTAVTGHTAETSIADGDLVLIHDASASALRKMTKANFVAGVGGLSVADNWRLASSDVVDSSETDLDTGWEQVDSTGQGTVGSAMSQSSGVFTFPSTGIYHVQFTIHYRNEQAENYGRLIIAHKNGSTFTHLVDVRQLVQHSDTRQTITASTLFDVQNTSNDTVVFFGGSGQNNIEIYGNTGYNATAVTFLKVGAT